jgi:hypothetical protein
MGLHPIATRAYFRLVSLSNTGYVMKRDELKQNAIKAKNAKNIILKALVY